jgi:glycerol uptake facilitator-like aquaporin
MNKVITPRFAWLVCLEWFAFSVACGIVDPDSCVPEEFIPIILGLVLVGFVFMRAGDYTSADNNSRTTGHRRKTWRWEAPEFDEAWRD